MKYEPEMMWKVLLLRNKGKSLNRIAEETGLHDTDSVRNYFAAALRHFSPDHISQLVANNRIHMPEEYK